MFAKHESVLEKARYFRAFCIFGLRDNLTNLRETISSLAETTIRISHLQPQLHALRHADIEESKPILHRLKSETAED
jgi:hypothetical protein